LTIGIDELKLVAKGIIEAERREFDPWFYKYCGTMSDPVELETYVRHKSDLLAFAGIDPRGASILDAGAGFGMTLIVLVYLGAAQAQGIESHAPMVRTANEYMPLLPSNVRERVSMDQGDVLAMPYEDETFDAVLSIEAISHYRDVERALREIHRVLRPGGVLAVSDGNNGLNPIKRRKTRQVWDAFEFGAYSGFLHGHEITHNYRAEREAFIREHYPALPAERLARETFGMTFDEVARACADYVTDGSLPGLLYDGSEVPSSPADGQVIERLFDPFALARTPRERDSMHASQATGAAPVGAARLDGGTPSCHAYPFDDAHRARVPDGRDQAVAQPIRTRAITPPRGTAALSGSACTRRPRRQGRTPRCVSDWPAPSEREARDHASARRARTRGHSRLVPRRRAHARPRRDDRLPPGFVS